MNKRLLSLVLFVMVISGFIGCGGSIAPKLQQGIEVIEYQMKPMNLSRSMYTAAFPNGSTATQYVSYMFSSMGMAEWPDSEEYAEMDPMIAEQAKAIRAPLSPKGVSFIPLNPNPFLENKMQIVVKPDDENHTVIIEAYENPEKKPVKTVVKKIPVVQGDPTAEMFFQSNIETGMSYQKF